MFRKILILSAALAGMLLVLAVSGYAWVNSNSLLVPEEVTDNRVRAHASLDSSTVGAAKAAMLELRRELSAPGLQASVRIGEDEFFNYSVGVARLEPMVPVTPQSRFPVGSVAKSMTAVIAARLAQRGITDLDSPIGAYIPDLPADKMDLTLRQLLSHQAGIRHYGFAFNLPYFSEFHSLTSYTTVVDSLAIFIDDPLLFKPDTSFSYSTYGYTLASAALEAAAKEDFQSLLETEVTEPANMTHTRLDRDPYLPDRVSSYPVNPFNKREVVYLGEPDVSNKWAGGGLVSTADDLTRFAAALLGDDLVEATWREELFAPRLLPDGNENPQHYGLGFRINRRSKESPAGNLYRAVHHGGTALGSQAFLVMLPEISLSVAVVINVNAGGSSLMLGRVTELLDLFVPLAEQRVPGPL